MRLRQGPAATVSRCLIFRNQVAERTRTKVMHPVKALSFSPNFGARAMAARRTTRLVQSSPRRKTPFFLHMACKPSKTSFWSMDLRCLWPAHHTALTSKRSKFAPW
nr:LacI family DNA-binding transcriptional regulator [Octadecabacter antarcticus]